MGMNHSQGKLKDLDSGWKRTCTDPILLVGIYSEMKNRIPYSEMKNRIHILLPLSTNSKDITVLHHLNTGLRGTLVRVSLQLVYGLHCSLNWSTPK